MITTTSRIEDKKPSELILPPTDILEIIDLSGLTNPVCVNRIGLRSVISVRRPSSRSSSWKNSVLSHNKIHPANVEVHARILDTSPVVVKTRFAVVIPLNAKDKESIASQSTSLFKQVRALRSYMQTKAKTIIMKYLVRINKKSRILELKRRHLKITVLASNMSYPLRKIRRIYACTSLKTTKEQNSIRCLRKKYLLSLKNDIPPRNKTRSTETSDGLAAIQAQLNNLGREIKKVNEKVYVAQVRCEQCKGPHYTKDCPLKEEGKTLEEAYYTQFGGPFQGGGYRAAALGFYQRNNANPLNHERRQSMEETLSKFMNVVVRNQGASIKTLEIQIGQISKVLQERGFGSLPSSTKANPRDYVKSISTTAKADLNPICRIRSTQYAVSTSLNRRLMFESRQTTILFPSHLNNYYCEGKKGSYGSQFSETYSYGASHIDNYIPRKEKDPGSFTLPCYINNVCFDNALADLGASVSVMPLSTYLNLGLGELAHTKLTVELAYWIVKYPKGIAENVLVCIGKFVFPIDFIILDLLEDVKVPLILGGPFLSTTHPKIDVFKRKITLRVRDEKIIFKSVKTASSLIKRVYMLSLRERMELDLEAGLMGETLVLNRSLDPLYGDYIKLNDLNVPLELKRDQVDDLMPSLRKMREFHNSIIKDKVEYKGKNVVKAFMNVPIFLRKFSVVTHFVVVENMDGYRDQDMGDIILGDHSAKLRVWKQEGLMG
ncbi:hypothetical protein Tco_0266201 [Tanacetum coccineum]